jgi:hypothetical protein
MFFWITTDYSKKADSVPVINNEFIYKTYIKEPKLVHIQLWKTLTKRERDSVQKFVKINPDVLNYELFQLYLEPGVVTIIADSLFSDAKVSGCKSHKEWEELSKQTRPIHQKSFENNQAFNSKSMATGDSTGLFADVEQLQFAQEKIVNHILH